MHLTVNGRTTSVHGPICLCREASPAHTRDCALSRAQMTQRLPRYLCWSAHMCNTALLLYIASKRYFMYSRLTHADMLCVYRQLVHGSGACSATLWRGCERITVPSHYMPICYVLPMRTCCACTLLLGYTHLSTAPRGFHMVGSRPARATQSSVTQPITSLLYHFPGQLFQGASKVWTGR